MESLGAKLRAARIVKGLRQEDVAKELSLSRTAYTKYEIGRSEPPLETLCKLCRLFDISVTELLADYM